MGFLFILFFVVILFVFLLPSIILSLISAVLSWLGVGRKRGGTGTAGNENVGYTHKSEEERKRKNERHKKVFGKDEGEYVDFEEIK